MLACNRLRIDPDDGSPVLEYRIENGSVEGRTAASEIGTQAEMGWHQLTADQISSHVMANTVIAEWLRRRMGLHQLLRACTPVLSPSKRDRDDCRDRIAA
jgi:hypothetical protein